ncbi:MAG: Nif3-like dinuclear metal center hexameric protein [Candidatus Nanohaloarchaea archaeon]|nr:Nif3-like dinuclear metal center hexameric protein [Candidatus Nanohaloarchaea archaeon]
MKARDLVSYMDDELDVESFEDVEDAKFNGALVEVSGEVEKVGLCTNFTRENIRKAAGMGLDLVVSHHGGWKEFDADLLEEKRELAGEESLTWYVAHEPLDCADGYGVSAALARRLGVEVEGSFGEHAGGEVGRYGTISVGADGFLDRLSSIDEYEVVDGEGRHTGGLDVEGDEKVAVVGGGGGVFVELIQEAAELGCDLYVTGNSMFAAEIYSHEKGIDLVTLEETSSERWGVYAFGEHLKEKFPELEFERIPERNW